MRIKGTKHTRSMLVQGLASLRDCRKTGPITTVLPSLPGAREEVEVDGVFVPDGKLQSTADMNYVLNQEPGKLRIKDIKHAIRRCSSMILSLRGSGLSNGAAQMLACPSSAM